MKKIFILITILAIGILSCKNKQNENTEVGVSQNNTSNITEQSQKNNYNKTENTNDFPDESNQEYPGGMSKGINEQFTTDGNLHEEQFLNKTFSYTDTADSFKIQKDSKGYFLTKYIDESAEEGKEVPVKEETVRLKLINGTFLVEDVSKNDGNLAYAYDTKLQKVVFINPYNKFKIMLIAN